MILCKLIQLGGKEFYYLFIILIRYNFSLTFLLGIK